MAILYGTQSNGDTLPVEVNEFGQLVAKGIEGPPGPEGPPGVGELPPGAFDGAVLGWENGELVWFGTPIPPVSSTAFRPVVYSGNGGTQSINCGFSPDLVWIKQRTDTQYHCLTDTVRGFQSSLASNTTDPEDDRDNRITSFDSDGFSIGDSNSTNTNTQEYIAWCWNAGDTTVTNNDGEQTSQVRSNGNFSVITYTALGGPSNVGHGLGNIPAFIIIKDRTSSSNWTCYHQRLGSGKALFLNLVDTSSESSIYWNNTDPTDTTFNIGSDVAVSKQNGESFLI